MTEQMEVFAARRKLNTQKMLDRFVAAIKRYDDDIYDLNVVILGKYENHHYGKRALTFDEMKHSMRDYIEFNPFSIINIYQSTLYKSDILLLIKEE